MLTGFGADKLQSCIEGIQAIVHIFKKFFQPTPWTNGLQHFLMAMTQSTWATDYSQTGTTNRTMSWYPSNFPWILMGYWKGLWGPSLFTYVRTKLSISNVWTKEKMGKGENQSVTV
jgi:hypothetical protein